MSQNQSEINMEEQVKGRFVTESPKVTLLVAILELVKTDSKLERTAIAKVAVDAFEEYEAQIKEGQS